MVNSLLPGCFVKRNYRKKFGNQGDNNEYKDERGNGYQGLDQRWRIMHKVVWNMLDGEKRMFLGGDHDNVPFKPCPYEHRY